MKKLTIYISPFQEPVTLIDVCIVHQAFPAQLAIRDPENKIMYVPIEEFERLENEADNFHVFNLELLFKLLGALPRTEAFKQYAVVMKTLLDHYKNYQPVADRI
jgi:hypothetical protein